MRRSSSIIAAVAIAALAFAPSFADARAGGGRSMGSRGSQTHSAPPSTNTAPSAASPMERTATPRTAPTSPAGAPMQQPARSGFMSGMMGGLLGVGIGSLLFGGGLGGLFGNGSIMGFLSLLLQAALLFFVVRWAVRKFMQRQQPSTAGGPNFARTQQPAPAAMAGGMMGGAAAAVEITKVDYTAFEQNLQAVQAAWTAGDVNALRQVATPEMAGYFAEQLEEQASRGTRNSVTHVKLEQGDLSQAWAEGERQYATVAMRFSSLDVTRDSNGRVVDGDLALRSMATELWTFMRVRGGPWMLSAIQQTR